MGDVPKEIETILGFRGTLRFSTEGWVGHFVKLRGMFVNEQFS